MVESEERVLRAKKFNAYKREYALAVEYPVILKPR